MSKKIIKSIIILVFLLSITFSMANFAMADNVDVWGGQGGNIGSVIGLGGGDPRVMVARIIQIFLGFLGIIAVILTMYAGWMYMTADGDDERINKAKAILKNAVIGLIIILLSFAIVSLVLNKLLDATTGGGPCVDGDTASCGCGGIKTCSAGVWGSCVGSDCGGGDNNTFYISKTVPYDQAINQVRNITVKAFFNKLLDDGVGAGSNFKIKKIAENITPENLDGTSVGPIVISGDVAIAVSKKEINFKALADCGDENNTQNCFDEWSKFEVNINSNSGIISADGQSLECVGNACKFEFSTSDSIDSGPPTAGIYPEQICEDDGSLLEDANTVGAWGRDDVGISAINFYHSGFSLPVYTEPGNTQKFQSASHKYDTSGMMAGAEYTFTAEVMDMANAVGSANFTTTIKPGHCCNGAKDADEEDVDCGGVDCLSCSGGPCNKTEPNECMIDNINCDDSLCSTQFCDCKTDGCICESKPIIDWITPIGGFCENDVNKFCTDNSDCASTCNVDTANSAVGNLVTIGGRYFGETPGTVQFSNDSETTWINAELANTVNANCDSSWQDRQIIVVMPTGLNVGDKTIIKITSQNGYWDVTNDATGPQVDFIVNNIERPGLCKLDPDSGIMNEEIIYYGINLSGNVAYFGNVKNNIAGLNSVFSSNLQGIAQTPNIKTGRTTTFVLNNNGINSNYLDFTTNKEPKAGPSIAYFEPVQGAPGQYVTIYGSNFGRLQGSSKVFFGDETGAEANYSFPQICEDSIWSDNQIIIKVPEVIADGNYILTMQIGTPTADNPAINTGELSPSEFQVSLALDLSPSLCKIDPVIGANNSAISLWGEYFGDQSTGLIRFSVNKDQTNNIVLWGQDGNENADKIETIVHQQAVTGPVKVVQSGNAGNGINFTVGECAQNSDCGGTDVCCPAGSSEAGRCQTDENACYINVQSSVYEWDFSTGGSGVGDPCDSDLAQAGCQADNNMCVNELTCDPASCTCQSSQCSVDQTPCGTVCCSGACDINEPNKCSDCEIDQNECGDGNCCNGSCEAGYLDYSVCPASCGSY
ncbi:IPT/TIG domain-containing protein, partial [Patescibacteria group bacterium]|nr:IPT/TIG domain-containing protein [Patescibacteria group bacterium]